MKTFTHLVTCLAFLFVPARHALAAEKQWTGGTSWTDPSAWSPPGVPEVGDDIRIAGGNVTLPGAVEIGNRLTWTGGMLTGGSLRIAPGAVLDIGGDEPKGLNQIALRNAGLIRVSGSGPVLLHISGYDQSLVVTNESGGVVEWEGEADWVQSNVGGWMPAALRFVNEGTVLKSGTGTNELQNVPLENRGRVEVNAGRLRASGGGRSPGLFVVAANAAVDLAGNSYDFGDARFEGNGPVRIVGNTTLQGTFVAANFGLEAGDLGGNFDVAGGFTWTGGRLVSAQARLGPGEHRIAGAAEKELLASTLANAGHLVLDRTVVGLRISGYDQVVVLTNEPGGVLELVDGARLEQRNAGGWPPVRLALSNAGTLRSQAADANVLAATPFHNQGLCEVISGMLAQDGGGVSRGEFRLAAGTALEWRGGIYDFAGSRWHGPGTARVAGVATVNGAFDAEVFELASGSLAGSLEVRGGFGWTGGTLVNAQIRLGPGEHRIAGAAEKELLASTLANAGHLVLDRTVVGLRISDYDQVVVLTNEPGGVLELVDGARLEQRNAGGWPPVAIGLENAGTLRSAGAGTNRLMQVPLHHRGLLEVTEGVLQQTGGGSADGEAVLAAGARVELGAGTYHFAGSRWSGAGPVRIVGNTTLQGTFVAANFGLEAGDLGGNFDVAGGFTWTGGRLVSAQARLGPGEHRIAGAAEKELLASTLANAGHLVLDRTVVGLRISSYAQVVVLTNEPGGVLELVDGACLEQRNAGGWPPVAIGLENAGTLRSAGAGTNRLMQVPLHHRGLLEVTEGVLQQTGGGSADGEAVLAAGARVELGAGTYHFAGSRWSGAGPVRIVGNTTLQGTFVAANFGLEAGDLGGNFDVAGGFTWTGGRLVSAQARLGPGEHRIAGAAEKELLASTLANAGHLVLDRTVVGLRISSYAQVVVLTNEPGGVLELVDGARLEQRNAGGWPPVAIGLENAGTLRSLGAVTNSLTGLPLRTTGSLLLETPLLTDGSVTLGAEGRTVVRLGATPVLGTTGSLALGGTLEASTAPGQSITADQRFDVMEAGSLSGSFATSAAANPGHVFDYPITTSANRVTLTARQTLTEPVNLKNLSFQGGSFSLGVGAPPGLLCRLEVSTNLVDWEVAWITNTTGALTFRDAAAVLRPYRFFRLGLFP